MSGTSEWPPARSLASGVLPEQLHRVVDRFGDLVVERNGIMTWPPGSARHTRSGVAGSFDVCDAEVRQGVDDGVDDRRRCCDGAGFADSLDPRGGWWDSE